MKRFRHGLVVGKFSPLHRGHEALIGRAIEACDEVVLLSYSRPEFAGCEANRREYWLAERFPETRRLVVDEQRAGEWGEWAPGRKGLPHNDDLAENHRLFCCFLCRRVLGIVVDAVFTGEDYGDGFAARLTALFREENPSAPVVTQVRADVGRRAVPVSGTLIRNDVHGLRHWLSPVVYASFVRRVALLGGESTGKSSLAAALAARLGTEWVPEYGRELWEARDGRLQFEDMEAIALEQVSREERLARRSYRYLFCDTTPLTTLFYSRHLFGKASPHLERMAGRPYDVVLLCGDDFPFRQDGTRQDGSFRRRQQDWYRAELARRGIESHTLAGPPADRIDAVSKLLGRTE